MMIDNVIKKYLQNAINKTNKGSMPVEMYRIFNLPFIGMYSEVTQNKMEKPCKNEARLFFQSTQNGKILIKYQS